MKNKYLLIIFLIIFGASCNSVSRKTQVSDDKTILEIEETATSQSIGDIPDPWEPFNRRMYYFNAKLDKYIFLPTANAYKAVTPDPVEKGVHNFFKNLGEIKTFSNSVLQGETKKSLITFNRFAINSTFGVFGIFDLATKVGLKRQKEDFGLTLAKYGVKDGPYLVLPVFGPSTLRDATGIGVDSIFKGYADPLKIADASQNDLEIMAINAIDTRANIDFRYHQTNSPFEYELVRYLYFKLRELEGVQNNTEGMTQ